MSQQHKMLYCMCADGRKIIASTHQNLMGKQTLQWSQRALLVCAQCYCMAEIRTVVNGSALN